MKNILFILADCLRSDLVFGGERRVPLPQVDRLKEIGVSFTQTISSATMTSPCVSSFFTGCYPIITGIHALRGDVLNSEIPTLAELLQARGYHTCGLVTGPLWEGLGLERGFERYEYCKPGTRLSDTWRDRIAQYAREADKGRPWFIYAHFFDLHAPRVVAPDLNGRQAGATLYERAAASLDRRLGEILASIDLNDTVVVFHADHGELFPHTLWLEAREKIWQDYILGRKPPLMRIGIRRDPTVRAWTNLKRATRMGHGFDLSEGLIRVPLIISGLGAELAGKVVSTQTRQVDIMPTILEVAGLPVPAGLSGKSVFPLMRGDESGTRAAYIEARAFGRDPNFNLRGIRTPDWKYVDSPTDGRVKQQLYSLKADPQEKHNVIDRFPTITAQLKQLMDQETAAIQSSTTTEDWSEAENAVVEGRLRDLGYF